MGFFDDLAKNAALWAAVEASKDKNGKPDSYKAAGMAAGMGNFSLSDRARLGAMLGSQGAFDKDTDNHYSGASDFGVIDNSWRDLCEDGSEYGIDPEDYKTEEEYEEAISEAAENAEGEENVENTGIILGLSVNCPALDKLDAIKREDYLNQRRFDAAYTLANEFRIYADEERKQKEDARCRFILECADNVLAANYLSNEEGFLYAQAIKEHFTLPCSLPDEDAKREMEFPEILIKIARYDIQLSFEIWSWCLQEFLPYIQYDDHAGDALSMDVIDRCYSFPDGYTTKLVHYMEENREFHQNFMAAGCKLSDGISEFIVIAILERLYAIAENLFKMGLDKACGQWKKINRLTEGLIIDCKNYEEYESMKYCRDSLLPLVKAIDMGMVQDEISKWEKEIKEYIDHMEENQQQETQRAEAEEIRKKQHEKRLQKLRNKQTQISEHIDDKTVYTYCGVLFPFSKRVFSYRTKDTVIQVGDMVVVPVGRDNEEMEGKVVSVGQYARAGVPYPIESTKFILRKQG